MAVGEIDMAEQALQIAISLDSSHAEALNNLGILAQEAGKEASGKLYFQRARAAKEDIFEPWFNGAMHAMNDGTLQTAFDLVRHVLDICPDHEESKKMHNDLLTAFASN